MDRFDEEALWELDTPLPDLGSLDMPYNWESEPLSNPCATSAPSFFASGVFEPITCYGPSTTQTGRSVTVTDPQEYLSNPSSPISGSATSPSTSPCSSGTDHQLSDRTTSQTCPQSIGAKTPLRQMVDFFPVAMGGRAGIFPGLSKPAFSPDGSGVCAFGTEEPCKYLRTKNRLFISQVDADRKCLRCGLTGLLFISVNVSEPVRDVTWVNGRTIVAALGRSLSLYRLDANMHLSAPVQLPWEHRDDIRELAVNRITPCRIASGGFDKTVLVGNIEVLRAEITVNLSRVCSVDSVVSSVAWCPQEREQLSITTDDGLFRMFDLRSNRPTAVSSFDHGKYELYTHSYRSPNIIFFGFGNGTISVHDCRKGRPCHVVRDLLQEAVGELRFSPDMRSCAAFGHTHVSLWDTDDMDRGPALRSYTDGIDPTAASNPLFKTSGDFVPNSSLLAVTDSLGRIALYDV